MGILNKLCLAIFIVALASEIADAQEITSVNGETGNVQINLLLNGFNLSITGSNTVILPNEPDTLWNFTASGSNIVANTSGNVGIGTDTFEPNALLTVNGKIHTQELISDLDFPGPDYVFEHNYKLMNLYKLEKFIVKNKHLPEIPSAKEMETEGINLTKMNMLILKKTEELTLYVIDHEKRIEKLEHR